MHCKKKKVVLEQIKDGGESVANLFISLKEMGCVMNSLIIFKELVSILVLNYFVIALSRFSYLGFISNFLWQLKFYIVF